MDGPLILICSTKLRSLTYIHAWVEKILETENYFANYKIPYVALRQDKKKLMVQNKCVQAIFRA